MLVSFGNHPIKFETSIYDNKREIKSLRMDLQSELDYFDQNFQLSISDSRRENLFNCLFLTITTPLYWNG